VTPLDAPEDLPKEESGQVTLVWASVVANGRRRAYENAAPSSMRTVFLSAG